jgi:hypothetical protein
MGNTQAVSCHSRGFPKDRMEFGAYCCVGDALRDAMARIQVLASHGSAVLPDHLAIDRGGGLSAGPND